VSEQRWSDFYEGSEELVRLDHYLSELATHREFLAAIVAERPRRVLEVGAATGRMSVFLSHLGLEAVGVDRDRSLVARARRVNAALNGRAEFLCADAFALPFGDDAFDLAFHQGLLEHFDDGQISALLHEQLRVATTVAFSVPNQHYERRDFGDERGLSRQEWEAVLGGFHLVESRDYCKKPIRTFLGLTRRRPIMYMARIARG